MGLRSARFAFPSRARHDPSHALTSPDVPGPAHVSPARRPVPSRPVSPWEGPRAVECKWRGKLAIGDGPGWELGPKVVALTLHNRTLDIPRKPHLLVLIPITLTGGIFFTSVVCVCVREGWGGGKHQENTKEKRERESQSIKRHAPIDPPLTLAIALRPQGLEFGWVVLHSSTVPALCLPVREPNRHGCERFPDSGSQNAFPYMRKPFPAAGKRF